MPRIAFSDHGSVYKRPRHDLWARDLEDIAHRLWWMSKVDSHNVSALHRQHVKARKIVITDEVKPHLLWTGNTIFIKPIPEYLMLYDFWTRFLISGAVDGNWNPPREDSNRLRKGGAWLFAYICLPYSTRMRLHDCSAR
ncbi:hypothetical protein QBC38DRAFT_457444 [Podospora fimiseda]|uniref:Uncharacterized protein n=1 Tax=Podospora fimiseda TaxID=252190 RepID=A0AAN7BL24_9PEZI|nr:hypothetical protein QBC38DRAFT_457444 [Podospora fimiseda]